MKKTLLIAVILGMSLTGVAQKIEITPQYGYQLGAKYSYYGGHIKLTSSDQYGFTMNVGLSGDVQGEFYWVQQNAAIKVKDVLLYPHETELTDVKVNHYQIGAIHTFGYSEAIPFLGLSAGWSTFAPDEPKYNSETTFTIGVSGGLKYFFTDRIGIRIQTQLLMPINWGGVYFGSGGSGVTASGSILQLNFSGGLIFAFGS